MTEICINCKDGKTIDHVPLYLMMRSKVFREIYNYQLTEIDVPFSELEISKFIAFINNDELPSNKNVEFYKDIAFVCFFFNLSNDSGSYIHRLLNSYYGYNRPIYYQIICNLFHENNDISNFGYHDIEKVFEKNYELDWEHTIMILNYSYDVQHALSYISNLLYKNNLCIWSSVGSYTLTDDRGSTGARPQIDKNKIKDEKEKFIIKYKQNIFRLFESLLPDKDNVTPAEYKNMILQIVMSNKLFAVPFAQNFMNHSDLINDIHDSLIKFLQYANKLDKELIEYAHYYLAQIRRNKTKLNIDDKKYIISHLMKAGNVVDAKKLRTRLFESFFLNKDGIGDNLLFDINMDVDTMISLSKLI